MALGIAWASALLVLFVSVFIIDKMGVFQSKNQFPVDGRVNFLLLLHSEQALTQSIQTVLLTGGSDGMGKAVGILLAKKGANVVIVARNVEKLEAAIKEISVRS